MRVAFGKLGWPEPGVGFFFLALLSFTAVSYLSFRFVEKPLLRMKREFSSEAEPPERYEFGPHFAELVGSATP
jgi:peptidoglycan/LPS O-acetylase OafA/YrhL